MHHDRVVGVGEVRFLPHAFIDLPRGVDRAPVAREQQQDAVFQIGQRNRRTIVIVPFILSTDLMISAGSMMKNASLLRKKS